MKQPAQSGTWPSRQARVAMSPSWTRQGLTGGRPKPSRSQRAAMWTEGLWALHPLCILRSFAPELSSFGFGMYLQSYSACSDCSGVFRLQDALSGIHG